MSIDNARAVVQTWRRGEHLHVWGEAARGVLPSVMSDEAANSLAALAATCDREADRLIRLGYARSHQWVRDLRDDASRYTREATRLREWAKELREAERE